jgi:hypothetical protein
MNKHLFRFRTYWGAQLSYNFFHADHAPFVWAAVLAPVLTALIWFATN